MTGGKSSTYNYRSNSYPARVFGCYSKLVIKSNLTSSFTVSYTNFEDVPITQEFSQGAHDLYVKFGTEVTVVPAKIGNLVAETQKFLFTNCIHELNFTYAKDAGVYIQHVSGAFYSESEWTAGGYSNSDANGVAMLSATSQSFVLAKEDVPNSPLPWGGYGKLISGLSNYSSSMDLINDTDGYGYTLKIIESLSGYEDSEGIIGAPAAEACVNYLFPNGKRGYLPSFGELYTISINLGAFKSAFSLIGSSFFAQKYYWTSSQNSSGAASTFYFRSNDHLSSSSSKYDEHLVRALTTI